MNDDHEMATCPKAGTIGHWMCGACSEHGCPRFECGCVLRMSGEVDGVGRATPGTVRLALLFEHGTISVGPRDAATREWLENMSGALFCSSAIQKLAERWRNAGIAPRDLPRMAAELQGLITDRYREHAERHNHGSSGTGWYHPTLTVEVRACEWVAPEPTHLELRELR